MPNNHAVLMKRAATASVATAVTLLFAKIFAWTISDSTSVLSSLIDSSMDIIASGINLFAVRYALMPADEDHPFGHTKAEGIAALLQSAFILGSTALLLLQVLERFLNPRAIHGITESVGVMTFSVVLTIILVLYQRYVARKTNSLAIKADAAHYYGDILAGIAVVIALLTSRLGWYWMDPVVALMIAMILLYSVVGIVREALAMLMDQALDPEEEEHLHELILGCDNVKGVHDVLTRQSGKTQFIQLHLELDGQQSLYAAHAITLKVEQEIKAAFPDAQLIIHQDPV